MLHKRFKNDYKGSITLEAVMIFPILIALLLLLINFIKIASVYIAMDYAVSETTKQIAVHSYPLRYLNVTKKGDFTGKLNNLLENPDIVNGESLHQLAIAQVSDIFDRAWGKWLENNTEIVLENVIEEIARWKIKELYPLGALSDKDFIITDIETYNPNHLQSSSGSGQSKPNAEDVTIKVEYKVKILIPFFPIRELTLVNSAVERAWTDD